MSVYLIHAYDEIYSGNNGVEDWYLMEGTLAQAVDIAREISIEVIDSYSSITDELWERAKELAEEDDNDDVDYYYDEELTNDIVYDIVRLKPNYTLEEYEELVKNNYKNDWETFWSDYGEKEYK